MALRHFRSVPKHALSTIYPSDLSDAEWEHLQRHLPPLPTRGRPRTHSMRTIFDAIFYVLRTGCAWRYLPCNYPQWPTVFYTLSTDAPQGDVVAPATDAA